VWKRPVEARARARARGRARARAPLCLALQPALTRALDRPNSYLARSPASDTARVEERTFICSESKEGAGFNNNYWDPEEATKTLTKQFEGSMRGRCMYVVPFCMGPYDSPFSKVGLQITDSPYVVVSMRIMTRMGAEAMKRLGNSTDFVPCVHSVGRPLSRGEEDAPWPCRQENKEKYIVHFPEQYRIWSYGSGYGGNALLGKKCLALRIASYMGLHEGWLAEHMLIIGVTNPQGVKRYFAAAFPSACGKTNLAMMKPRLPGWKVETVGDDIAWIRVGADGRFYAVNPEYGFFGVAPGTSVETNPNAMAMLDKNVLFTNVALTDDGDVWWEGMTKERPTHLTSWLRRDWYGKESSEEAAHPNSRFTVPLVQCPTLDPEWNNPNGVPLSGIIFGGRRSQTVPLVYQARDWAHGTFLGATMNSETTAAAAGARGVLRPDPFAMKPFLGYNMGDYFGHWLTFSERTQAHKLPKIFHVNWFRKSRSGGFLWPGFGDNIRVMKWIFERSGQDELDESNAMQTPIGLMPKPEALDTAGLKLDASAMEQLLRVDPAEWRQEITRYRSFFSQFDARLPKQITEELERMSDRISRQEREQTGQSRLTDGDAVATALN
jgi:phosphoenolpyruvate carboxykinase (GTP)